MNGQPRNTLSKKERLHGRTDIETLLRKGRFGNVPGIRFCCLQDTGHDSDRIMVSVPKKLFKRAVKRNLLKRRIRESYRIQKQNMKNCGGTDILFTYSTKEIMSYEDIYHAVGLILERIGRNYDKTSSKTDGGER